MTAELEHQKILLPSSKEGMLKLETLIDTLADNAQLSEEMRGNILVSVSEALRNAIEFGNLNDVAKLVHLNIDKKDNEWVFTVKDEGKGFDFDNIADPTAPENIHNITGRGIFL